MTIQGSAEGQKIVSESEIVFTNEHGVEIRRTETLLENGTRLIKETPVVGAPPTHPAVAMASAPMEDLEADIPIVHATSVPTTSVSTPSGTNLSGSVAVVTGPPNPPRVAVVTGTPRPPQQVHTHNHFVRRNENNALVCCGLSIGIFALLVCCLCCVLPIVVFFVAWDRAVNDLFDDDFFDDAFFADDFFSSNNNN